MNNDKPSKLAIVALPKIAAAPFVALLLTACGGSEGGYEGDTEAITAAETANLAPATKAAADPASASTDSAATAPEPVQLAPSYPERQLAGARSNPMYWLRQYTILYQSGTIVIRALPTMSGPDMSEEEVPPERTLSWASEPESTQHQDAATFAAPTTDGRRAWITVHRDGYIMGGGYHGDAADQESYLRLGDPYQDGPPAAPEQKTMVCQNFSSRGEPVTEPNPFLINVVLDRRDYPWSSMRVESAAPTPQFVDDPQGAFRTGMPQRRQLRLSGDQVIPMLGMAAGGYEGLTEYRLVDGKLQSIRHTTRHNGTDCIQAPQ